MSSKGKRGKEGRREGRKRDEAKEKNGTHIEAGRRLTENDIEIRRGREGRKAERD